MPYRRTDALLVRHGMVVPLVRLLIFFCDSNLYVLSLLQLGPLATKAG